MRRHKIAIAALLLLITLYILEVFMIPPDASALLRYHLSVTSARLLSLTVVIPLILIWSIALYGYVCLNNYAHSIKSTPDGKALAQVSYGILALALWLPLNSVLQNTLNYIRHSNPGLTEGVVIISNYLSIVFLLTIAYLTWRGSRQLLYTLHPPRAVDRRFLYVGTILFGILFSYIVLMNPAKVTPISSGVAAYYLPDILLVLTIIIPNIIIWYFGIEAVQNIHVYRSRVKGVIYKSALGYLASGIAFSIIGALSLRSITSLVAWLNSTTLKLILIVLYTLIFVIGLGYLLLWMGAKKLQLIEEV
jgi:hypothetical protein